VIKARTWFTLFIVSLGTVAATASCGSDEAIGGANAGAAGGSIISGAGRAGGSVGRAGSSGGGGASSGDGSTLGIECTVDTQCGAGMVCIKANSKGFGEGGPSHGMCTMPCEPQGLECGLLKPGAECWGFGTTTEPQGYCLDACQLGDPPVGALNTKCAGRPDFVCADLGQTAVEPFCVPHCRSDAECGSGLFCDKSSLLGLCVSTKRKGDPVGTACDPEADANTCEGYCIRTSATDETPVTGACVELCSGGLECMYGSGSKPVPGGFCSGPLSAPFGVLDLGYCLSSCSCSGDCPIPGDLCRKWPEEDALVTELLGAPGACFWSPAGSTELSCSEGGAGGAGGAGGDSAGGAGGDSAIPEAGGAAGSGI
jgi:hypothetical protein